MWGGLASMVLPRMRAAVPTTFLVVAIVAVATTLVASVPTYTDAVDRAALTLRLDETPSEERGVRVTARTNAADAPDALAAIDRAARELLPFDVSTLAFAQTGGLEVDRPVPDGAVISLAALDDVDRYFTTIARRTDGTDDAANVEPAAVHADVVDPLDLELGDVIELSRAGEGVHVVVDSIVSPVDRRADAWFSDPHLRDGAEVTSSFTEYAPFLVDPVVLARVDLEVAIEWRAAIGSDEIAFEDLDATRTAAAELEALDEVAGVTGGVDTATRLPALLDDLRDELDAGRSVVQTVLVQAVAVALAATAIGGAVAAHSRRREVELLRMRGASAGQLVAVAAVESTIIAVPAVAAGPFVAVGVVDLVDDRGPLETAGLRLEPALDWAAVAGAALVGAVAVTLLVAPSARAAFRLRSQSADRARGESWLLRNGVDLLVVVAATVIIWRLSDAPAATRGAEGRLGTDPLLLLAPGLGVVAGALVALRVVRIGAGMLVRVTRRRRALVVHLASTSARRRPSATSRVSTLVVMAVGVGVFAAMLAASWERSHVDRADALVSADILAEFSSTGRPDAVEPAFRSAGARSLDDVRDAVPVDVQAGTLGSGTIDTVVVATDTERFDAVSTFAPTGLSDDAIAALGSQRLGGIELVAEATDGAVDIELTTSVVTASSSESIVPRMLVSDRHGTLWSFEFDAVPASGEDVTRRVTLGSDVLAGVGLAAPFHLVELEFVVPVPLRDDAAPVNGRLEVRIAEFTVDGRAVGVADSDLVVGPLSRPSGARAPFTAELLDAARAPTLLIDPGVSEARRATLTVRLVAEDRGDRSGRAPVPAIVSAPLAERLGAAVGDEFPLRVDGVVVAISVADVAASIPFAVDEPNAVLVDWGTLQSRRFVDTDRRRPPGRLALVLDDARAANPSDLADELDDAALGFDRIIDRRSLAREFADQPVDVALLGALLLSGGAVVVIALIGLVMNSFVMAQDRRTTSAYLRAMGVSRLHVRRWLLAEVAPVVAVSVAIGALTGVLLARLGVDGLTLTEDGSSVVPEPVAVAPVGPMLFVIGLVGSAALMSPVAAIRLLRRSRPSEELRAGAAR